MKNLIVTGIMVLGIGFASSAQETNMQQKHNQMNQQNQQFDRDMQTHSDKMAKDLRLNDDQRTKLQEYNSTHYRNQQQMQWDNVTDTEQNDALRKSNERYDSELKNILDDEQYKRYTDNRDRYQYQSSGRQGSIPTKQGTQTRPEKH